MKQKGMDIIQTHFYHLYYFNFPFTLFHFFLGDRKRERTITLSYKRCHIGFQQNKLFLSTCNTNNYWKFEHFYLKNKQSNVYIIFEAYYVQLLHLNMKSINPVLITEKYHLFEKYFPFIEKLINSQAHILNFK